jgi:hypothetical protein
MHKRTLAFVPALAAFALAFAPAGLGATERVGKTWDSSIELAQATTSGGRDSGGGGATRGGGDGGGRAVSPGSGGRASDGKATSGRGDGRASGDRRPALRESGRQRDDVSRSRSRGSAKVYRRGTRYSWGPGVEFWFYNGYYYGDCSWLRRRAVETGSQYWWRRYRLCRAG